MDLLKSLAKLALSDKQIIEKIASKAGITIHGDKPYDITVHYPDFYSRVVKDGRLGLGESYMEGWWDCDRIDELVYRLITAGIHKEVADVQPVGKRSKQKAKKSVKAHYDIGDDVFTRMLDPMMMYTCGYWKGVNTLNEAQRNKNDLICQKLHLEPGMKVLDIGCGWGGFAEYAAKNYGVHVTGVTLSHNQEIAAKERCRSLSVEILNRDYRDVKGQFDAIVSIGMFEHIGPSSHDEFMKKTHKLLANDGLQLLHTIGSNASSETTDRLIEKYIFPDALIPSLAQISKATEGLFVIEDVHNFGPYYDKTLMVWYENFEKNWHEISGKYGEKFYRMWKYYLLTCAGGFRARHNQLWQIVLSKGIEGVYQRVS